VLVLVGEGGGDMHDCEPALRAFVARHGLESQVRFTGPVSNVQDWLQAADVFVFPTENEAFGLSLVEAMACGLPAVTTRVGGLRDFVEHGVNAWAIEPGDAAGLTAGLRALLTDAALAARLGATARETVLARFGEDAVAHAYEQLLSRIARLAPGSRRVTAMHRIDGDVTLVIPTLGRPILRRMLDAVRAGETWPARVIIVDQGRNAEIAALADEHRAGGLDVVYLPSSSTGRSAGLNLGSSVSRPASSSSPTTTAWSRRTGSRGSASACDVIPARSSPVASKRARVRRSCRWSPRPPKRSSAGRRCASTG
jgi:hypothetical protein